MGVAVPWGPSNKRFLRGHSGMAKIRTAGGSPKAYTRLPVDVLDALDRRAQDEGRTRSALVRHLLTEALEDDIPRERNRRAPCGR